MTALEEPALAPGSPSAVTPVVVHVRGVALGLAPWDAFDGTTVHVDLVPTYRFHARADDGGSTYDIEVLALDPAGFDLMTPPDAMPKNVPQPAPSGPAEDSVTRR